MCMDYKIICACGNSIASFNFRDNLMPVEVISRLYCPKCSRDIQYSQETMIVDNGWIIEYDMDIAKFAGQKLPTNCITPDYLFDEGYCTWRGIYPMDYIDSVKEKEDLAKMAKINPRKYIEEFKKWGINRMDRLTKEGWRKANEGSKVGV